MINILKNKRGSAMQLAIIAIALVGIGGAVITSMVVNQIKATSKSSQSLDLKYDVESGVEETIAEFIDKISAEGFKKEITEFNIIKLYVELADMLVKSNGVANTEINIILDKIGKGETVTKDEIGQIKSAIELAIKNEQGKSNPHADKLLNMVLKYTTFIQNNLFDSEGNTTINNINYAKCKEYINIIIENLSEIKFDDKSVEYGNISIAYRDTKLNNKNYKSLEGLYNVFNKTSGNIYVKLKELQSKNSEILINEWVEDNADLLIDSINDTNYKTIIDDEINLITEVEDYLNINKIDQEYKTTGSTKKDINDIVIQRLKIVKFEIDMLIDWINIMQNIAPDQSVEPGYGETLIIAVPKIVNLASSNCQVTYNTVNRNENEELGRVNLLNDVNWYKFEVIQRPSTSIVLDLKIISEINSSEENYKIESDIQVTIEQILSKNNYRVNYQVKDWKKV